MGISRRLFTTVAAAATILILTTSAVAAADPDALTSGAKAASSRPAAVLGARSHSSDAEHARPLLLHGGGLHLPATDIEAGALDTHSPASGVTVPLVAWVVVFLVGVLGSLRYTARRSRL